MSKVARWLHYLADAVATARLEGPRKTICTTFRYGLLKFYGLVVGTLWIFPLYVIEQLLRFIGQILSLVRRIKDAGGIDPASPDKSFMSKVKDMIDNGQADDALSHCIDYIKNKPNSGDVWCQIVSLQFDMGHPADAVRSIVQALESRIDQVAAYKLAYMLTKLCLYKDILLKTPMAHHEPVLELLNSIALTYDPIQLAGRCLTYAIEMDHSSSSKDMLASAYFLRGRLAWQVSRYGAAELDFRQAISMNPNLMHATIFLARALERRGGVNEALKILLDDPGTSQNSLTHLTLISELYLQRGDIELAGYWIRRAIRHGYYYDVSTVLFR